MPDLSQFDLKSLFTELHGQRLQNFVSARCFNDHAGFEAQTPSIYPLGQLQYQGGDGGRGSGLQWVTEDRTYVVDTDRDGIVTWVVEAR